MVDGLGEMVVGAHALRLTLVVVDGDHDHRHVGGGRVALEYFEELLPATVGQTQVEDDRRRDGSGDGRDALVDGGRDLGRESVLRGQRDDEVRVAASTGASSVPIVSVSGRSSIRPASTFARSSTSLISARM